MWVRNSGWDPVETENYFALSWLKYLWVRGLGWEDMSLERINLLFRHWNGIQFPILPLSTSVPELSCCWIDNSTHSSLHLVRACTLPCTVCAGLVSWIHWYNTSDNTDSNNSGEYGWQTSWRAEPREAGVPSSRLPFALYQQEMGSNVRGECEEGGGSLWRLQGEHLCLPRA